MSDCIINNGRENQEKKEVPSGFIIKKQAHEKQISMPKLLFLIN
jgi:hypothetical protein